MYYLLLIVKKKKKKENTKTLFLLYGHYALTPKVFKLSTQET